VFLDEVVARLLDLLVTCLLANAQAAPHVALLHARKQHHGVLVEGRLPSPRSGRICKRTSGDHQQAQCAQSRGLSSIRGTAKSRVSTRFEQTDEKGYKQMKRGLVIHQSFLQRTQYTVETLWCGRTLLNSEQRRCVREGLESIRKRNQELQMEEFQMD
jgi:hypothetical protein